MVQKNREMSLNVELNERKNILLHACCGVCSGYPISFLKEQRFNPIVYFCNPNLDTEDEFNKRLQAQKEVCNKFCVELIVEEYNHLQYLSIVKGLETEPEKGLRCKKCIEFRLQQTAEKAKQFGIEYFTTSLGISPHKDFELITHLGEELARIYGLKYLSQNFRKNNGVLNTNKIAKELNIYRQSYCGCEFAKVLQNNKIST